MDQQCHQNCITFDPLAIHGPVCVCVCVCVCMRVVWCVVCVCVRVVCVRVVCVRVVCVRVVCVQALLGVLSYCVNCIM